MKRNLVILTGRVGQDPEIRRLENGSVVANFSLATNRTYKDRSGERQKSTDWHNIQAWRTLAEMIEKHLKKGQLVQVIGRLTYDRWEDNDGVHRERTKVVIESIDILDWGKKEEMTTSTNSYEPTPSYPTTNETSVEADDDLPF